MRRKNRQVIKKYILLDKKKLFYICVAWIIAVILHNLIYALFQVEEALLFIIAVIIIPIYLIIAISYTLLKFLRKNKTP